jgi:hypothetical protein
VTAALLVAGAFLMLASPAFAQFLDVRDANDYPLFPRVGPYYIGTYETAERDTYDFPVAGQRAQRVEGNLTRITYWLKDGERRQAAAVILRAYEDQTLANAGRVISRTGNRISMRITTRSMDVWAEVVVSGDGDVYELAVVERAP